MTFARYLIGNAIDVLRSMPDQSVQSVITSPPYLAKRSYLAADDPEKPLEIGQEPTPASFLDALLEVTDDLWRVVRDDGTIWINLGDTASGSGGSGGDYNDGGLRAGQPKFKAQRWGMDPATEGYGRGKQLRSQGNNGHGWPRAKSVCWIPQLFGASLAYGRNLLTGEPCRQWVTRPPVTWCKPNPPVGEIIDKFREATELIVWAAKTSKPGGYYFDLDSLREHNHPERMHEGSSPFKSRIGGSPKGVGTDGDPNYRPNRSDRPWNEKGVPPLDWWEIPTHPYTGAHFATFPEALIRRPVIASCPPGGVILDPFAGSGTTLAVAFGHGRSSVGVDLDHRNAELARQRVGMWLEVEEPALDHMT